MDRYEVEFSNLTYGGDAMGRLPDGKAVFAPFVLPGELAEVEVLEEKKGHARARLLRLLRASLERIEPRCAHFGECGGCHYQHLPYEKQIQVKRDIVREQFARVGGLPDAPVAETIPSGRQWNYRNSLQFHLDAHGKPGFHRSGSHSVLPIRECWLPEPAIGELWPHLELDSLMQVDRLTLRCSKDEDPLMVLESDSLEIPGFETDMAISVVHRAAGHQVVLVGADFLTYEIKGRMFQVSAGSFFQVNLGQAERMVDFIIGAVQPEKHSSILDLYCGVGLFSAFLAEHAGQVIGVESNEEACADFAINLDAFDNVSLYQGEAGLVVPALDLHPDAILVDPPRSGIELQAMDAILRSGAGRLVYVSCDPATLARDVKRLTIGGYDLKSVQPVDMFPQTYHIEAIALLEK